MTPEEVDRLKEQLDEAAKVEARLERAKAELEGVEKALADTKEQLKSGETELTKQQDANIKWHDEQIFGRQERLKDVHKLVKNAEMKLEGLNANVKDAQARYDSVIAGIAALREKLR